MANECRSERIDEDDECVPFFKDDRKQIKFEFSYLIATLVLAISVVATIKVYGQSPILDVSTRALLFAALGGFLGGWVYDAKWFYRVTARGRNDQYAQRWQRHKFYWRMLTPFLAGLVAFSFYLLATSHLLPLASIDPLSGRAAFGLSFVLGYFSDLVLSRMAKWAESIVPKSNAS